MLCFDLEQNVAFCWSFPRDKHTSSCVLLNQWESYDASFVQNSLYCFINEHAMVISIDNCKMAVVIKPAKEKAACWEIFSNVEVHCVLKYISWTSRDHILNQLNETMPLKTHHGEHSAPAKQTDRMIQCIPHISDLGNQQHKHTEHHY